MPAFRLIASPFLFSVFARRTDVSDPGSARHPLLIPAIVAAVQRGCELTPFSEPSLNPFAHWWMEADMQKIVTTFLASLLLVPAGSDMAAEMQAEADATRRLPEARQRRCRVDRHAPRVSHPPGAAGSRDGRSDSGPEGPLMAQSAPHRFRGSGGCRHRRRSRVGRRRQLWRRLWRGRKTRGSWSDSGRLQWISDCACPQGYARAVEPLVSLALMCRALRPISVWRSLEWPYPPDSHETFLLP